MNLRSITALVAAALCLPSGAPGYGQERFVMTAQQVARAVSGRGKPITDDRVTLLASVVSAEQEPMLDVLSIGPAGQRFAAGRGDSASLVKLACHVPGACVPFYAIVRWPEAAPVLPKGGAVGSTASANSIGNLASNTMRAGTPAILIMDDGRSRVQVVVKTLQGGNTGDKIRVSSPDRKQIYTAEIVGENLLRRSY